MYAFIGLGGLAVIVAGVIGLLKPNLLFKRRGRKGAVRAIGIGLAMFIVGFIFTPPAEEEPDELPVAQQPAPEPTPAPSPTPAPAVVAKPSPAPAPAPPATDPDEDRPDASAGLAQGGAKESAPTPAARPDYNVIATENISSRDAKRIRLRMIVPVGSSVDHIEESVNHAIGVMAGMNQVQALQIWVYDREPDVERLAYTLAQAEWAPHGEWARAPEYRVGDYDQHKVSWQFRKKTSDPSMDRPSERQFELYDAVWALLDLGASDDEAKEAVADTLDASIEEIEQALNDCLMWSLH